MTATTARAAASALDQLTIALLRLAGRWRPRCGEPGDHGLWTSEDQAEREQAARLCAGCLVLEQCGEVGEVAGERFGVWGGIDRTPPRRPR